MYRRTRWIQLSVALMAVALVAGACSSSDSASDGLGSTGTRETITVEPLTDLPPLIVQVVMDDDGFEPDIIFLPAGRQIELILRNRGTGEHHFRVSGLLPGNLRWMEFPVIDEYDALSMTNEELAEYGADLTGLTDDAEIAHVMHHLQPTLVPYKPESPAGIKPLGTEVHGYVTLGSTEVMFFYPLQTGEFIAEDVLYPENTARVIVYAWES